MSFASLGLSAELLRALNERGYQAPTPIQTQTVPLILQGADLMAGAETGTGKTAAFTLPLLDNLMRTRTGGSRPVRAPVLTPTRELAAQVSESVRAYGRHLPLRSTEVYGGVNINPQIKALRAGVDVLVATPGRLIDHLTRRTVDLGRVEILVLDEADRMLDMGFMPAIQRIMALLPKQRQTLLFSATFSGEIRRLAQQLLVKPQMIETARSNAAAELVEQSVFLVDAERKRELLSFLIGSRDWRQVLIFTRTKHGADRLARQLEQDGIGAVAIHGDKSQGARTRALASFKRRSVQALVATDVAARGLDIDRLPHVINYELPHNPEDYVHRIGRTGRAGALGAAISLVDSAERSRLQSIQRLLNVQIPSTTVQGFEPSRAKPHRAEGPGARRSAGRPAERARSHGARPGSRPQGRGRAVLGGNR